MGNFMTYATDMKTNGIPFNKESYELHLSRVINSIKQRLYRENRNTINTELFLQNPYEIILEIGNTWGQEVLKIFYILTDRDKTRIGKMDATNRSRVDIFYNTIKQKEGHSLKLELIHLCLLIHVLEYEKEQILSVYKGGILKQSPSISSRFFGFKKNQHVYLDYVGRFVDVGEGRKAYTISLPNVNQLGLLSEVWGMDKEEAHAFLATRKEGLLHEQITKEVEERNLPFLLSDEGELFQLRFKGVLQEDFGVKVNFSISNDGVVTKKFMYGFNSNPYTFTISEYKIKTLTEFIEELERQIPDIEIPFVSDNRIVFTTAETTELPESNLRKYITPVDDITFYK